MTPRFWLLREQLRAEWKLRSQSRGQGIIAVILERDVGGLAHHGRGRGIKNGQTGYF